MKKRIWIERQDALAIHDLVLARHGGEPGLRDVGLLESALARPRHAMAYGKPTLAQLGAAYAAGIIRNHPFHDGNKRTGFLVAATFLEVNGKTFMATEESVVIKTVALAARKISEPAYARWLEENIK